MSEPSAAFKRAVRATFKISDKEAKAARMELDHAKRELRGALKADDKARIDLERAGRELQGARDELETGRARSRRRRKQSR
jgi:hypothetical protein